MVEFSYFDVILLLNKQGDYDMCKRCWIEFGGQKIDNKKVRDAVEKIKKVYDYSAIGGNLHLQIDDWNIGDNFFEDEFRTYGGEYSDEEIAAEKDCYYHMKKMSVDERSSALALYDGFWNLNEGDKNGS